MDSIRNCQLKCSCGRGGCLVGRGGYTRHVKTAMGKIPLAVRRVQCSLCNATHAFLPSSIVPYSQIPLSDHAAIASSYENAKNGMEAMDTNPELSPSQVFYILSLYIRFWRKPPPLPGPCPHTALHPPLRTPVHADKKYQEHPFCPPHITLGDFHTPFPYDGIKTERRFLINGTGLQTCHRSDVFHVCFCIRYK